MADQPGDLRIRAEGRLECIEQLTTRWERVVQVLSGPDWSRRLGQLAAPHAPTESEVDAARALIWLPGGPAYLTRLNRVRRQAQRLASRRLREVGWPGSDEAQAVTELFSHHPIVLNARHMSRVLSHRGTQQLRADRTVALKSVAFFAVGWAILSAFIEGVIAAYVMIVATSLVIRFFKTSDFLVLSRRGLSVVSGSVEWASLKSASMVVWQSSGVRIGSFDFTFFCDDGRALEVRWQGDPSPVLEALRQQDIHCTERTARFDGSTD